MQTHKAPARRSSSLHSLPGRNSAAFIALANVVTVFFFFMAFRGAAAGFIALARYGMNVMLLIAVSAAIGLVAQLVPGLT